MSHIESTGALNGLILLQSLKEGGQRIINKRNALNEINVFPVADQDTGSNLSSLMYSINEIPENYTMTIKNVLESVALKSLEGARGNSGMILAQYFNGVSTHYATDEDDTDTLVQSFLSAVDTAYEAVQHPQEGTMLSVMKSWALSLREATYNGSFETGLVIARSQAQITLLKTRTQHSVMKRNKVVDAGAQGFFEFLDGFTDALLGESSQRTHENQEAVTALPKHHHRYIEAPKYQYCMEVTYTGDNAFTNGKELLGDLGDSIVEVTGSSMSRLHIHTSNPLSIVEAIQSTVQIHKIKIDDMMQQHFDQNHNTHKTALVTDSIADLPREMLKTYNVHVLPLTILVDKTEHLDKLTLDNTLLMQMINEGRYNISSSLPSQKRILQLFDDLEQNYESAVFISVSSALSGTYNALLNACKVYRGPLNIRIIDSKLNSIAQGLLVKQAGEYINHDMDFVDIISKLEDEKGTIEIYVLVEDLGPMIRSGRIPLTFGRLFRKLRLKPIVTLNQAGFGKLMSLGLTQRKNVRRIEKLMRKDYKYVEDVLLGYTTNPTDVDPLSSSISSRLGTAIHSVNTSSIIALSAGNSAVAVAFRYERK